MKTMAPVIFYNDLLSQPCRAVYLFMKVTNIPFKSIKVDLMTGGQFDAEFTKINPIQRVPVIEDDGFVLGESGAIFRYLSEKHSVAEHWYPRKDPQLQARVDEYLHWHHINTRIPTMMAFRHQFINTVRGKPVKWNEVEKFRADVKTTVKFLDTYFLKDQPFLCGKDISVADIQAVSELIQLTAVSDENVYESNPKVKAWVDRVKTRLQPHFDESYKESVANMKAGYESAKASKL